MIEGSAGSSSSSQEPLFPTCWARKEPEAPLASILLHTLCLQVNPPARAVIDLSFWRRSWRDGKVHEEKMYFSESQIFVEIDRATNPITRLGERIQKYGKIWRGLSGNPAQVWVIGGSPWREKEVLGMMEEAGIDGWTVLMERLRLKKNAPWWGQRVQVEGVIPYSKHHG